jgi:hypothetical protein
VAISQRGKKEKNVKQFVSGQRNCFFFVCCKMVTLPARSQLGTFPAKQLAFNIFVFSPSHLRFDLGQKTVYAGMRAHFD